MKFKRGLFCETRPLHKSSSYSSALIIRRLPCSKLVVIQS